MNSEQERGLFASEPGRKGEILDAALDVFAERGYDGGSMREIASRVGVSEPALYRHFPGKEALFLTLLHVGGGRLRTEAFALIDGFRAQAVREQLAAAFEDRRKAVRDYAALLRAIQPALLRSPRFLAEFRDTIIDPIRERVTLKVAELDEAFGVADADATREQRVRVFIALFVGTFLTSLVLDDTPDAAAADAAIRLMGWDA